MILGSSSLGSLASQLGAVGMLFGAEPVDVVLGPLHAIHVASTRAHASGLTGTKPRISGFTSSVPRVSGLEQG